MTRAGNFSFLRIVLLLVPAFRSEAQEQLTRVIHVFPRTDFIQEIYYVKADHPDIKDGDYYSFYEGYFDKASFKNEKIDEDRIRGIKTRGSYFNNLKDSIWTIYYPPPRDRLTELNEIQEEGAYVNDRKTGVWYTFIEGGQVLKRFDADQHKEIAPTIRLKVIYPPKAKTNKTEGLVYVKITYDHCKARKYTIVKDIGDGCGKAVVNALKASQVLKKKYGLNDADCSKTDEVISSRFKL